MGCLGKKVVLIVTSGTRGLQSILGTLRRIRTMLSAVWSTDEHRLLQLSFDEKPWMKDWH